MSTDTHATGTRDPQVSVLDGCAVVTMDPQAREFDRGHVVLRGGLIDAVGSGPAPETPGAQVLDATGCLATPGLVNTHHHLFQWVTRGLAADDKLFGWLTTLYPIWAGIDEDTVHAAATAGLAWLAKTGCTTSMDHHYVFPRDGGDVLGAEIEAARQVGVRFLATRGSMDLGASRGGLPPDHVVEEIEDILAATAAAIERWHDPSDDAMLRIGVAPCSPFSVTGDLLREAATLARAHGVRLHTHLAETTDEEAYCAENFGRRPVEYLEDLGWAGPDVWFAHGIHFDDGDITRLAQAGSGVAHCPTSNARLGAGICRLRDLRAARVPVGLGVDGAASNEGTSIIEEARHALLFARARGGSLELSVREALETATIGGARVLGWENRIGSLEVGKNADVALWRLDTLAHADIDDPVAALVLGAPPPLERLFVAGKTVVERDRVLTIDEQQATTAARRAHDTLLARAGVA